MYPAPSARIVKSYVESVALSRLGSLAPLPGTALSGVSHSDTSPSWQEVSSTAAEPLPVRTGVNVEDSSISERVWECPIDGNKWEPYLPEVQFRLDAAVVHQEGQVEWKYSAKNQYLINVNLGTQTNQGTKQRREVRCRRPKLVAGDSPVPLIRKEDLNEKEELEETSGAAGVQFGMQDVGIMGAASSSGQGASCTAVRDPPRR